MLKTYEQFAPNPLLLPPHSPEKEIIKLKELYDTSNKNIHDVVDKINEKYDKGYYMIVTHLTTGIKLIYNNEPSIIFASKGGNMVSIGNNNNIKIPKESIIIYVKSDDSLIILSINDNYELTFIKPKIQISKEDPYGEEDWTEEIY